MKFRFLQLIIILMSFSNISAQQKNYTAGYYTIKVGIYTVTALLDGTVPVDANKLLKSDHEHQVDDLLKEAYINNPVETSINAYLIKTNDRLILIDTGAGKLFKNPKSGNLLESITNAGYNPDQITDILLTHIHIDHSGGLTVKGKMQFPNAIVHLDKKEIDFWQKHEKPEKDEPRGYTSNRSAFLALKPYLEKGSVKTFEGESQLFPDIRSVPYYGHTFGHCAFVLESESEKLVFLGDLVHIGAVQFHAPKLANEYDFDKIKAAEQRTKIYAEASIENYLIAADHIPFPGLGRLRKSDKGYEWIPVNFSSTGKTK